MHDQQWLILDSLQFDIVFVLKILNHVSPDILSVIVLPFEGMVMRSDIKSQAINLVRSVVVGSQYCLPWHIQVA